MHNRQRVVGQLALPAMPQWLEQVHGQTVARLSGGCVLPRADAAITRESGVVSDDRRLPAGAVLQPDAVCRGTCRLARCHGVLEQTLAQFHVRRARFTRSAGDWAEHLKSVLRYAVRFWRRMPPPILLSARPVRNILPISGCWQLNACRPLACDLSRLPRCTYQESADFFSFRRDGITGRMATLIWLR